MNKIEYIRLSEITTGHVYRPRRNTASKRHYLLEQYKQKRNRVEIGVAKNNKGTYTLVRGIDVYNCYSALNYSEPLPCFIYEEESTLTTFIECLQRCFIEKAYHKIRYEYITLLQEKYKLSIKEIAVKSNIDKLELAKYEIHPTVPQKYTGEIIRQEKQPRINEIAKDRNIPLSYKNFIYSQILSTKGLTKDKVSWIKRFFKYGFYLPYEKFADLFEELFDIQLAVHLYWEELCHSENDQDDCNLQNEEGLH